MVQFKKIVLYSWADNFFELKHDDALAEQNVQPRAFWLNTQTDCAALALYCHLTSCIRHWPHPFVQPKKSFNFAPAHDKVAAVLSHKYHPIIQVDHPRWCGPDPAMPWLAIAAGKGPDLFKIYFHPFFRGSCYKFGTNRQVCITTGTLPVIHGQKFKAISTSLAPVFSGLGNFCKN